MNFRNPVHLITGKNCVKDYGELLCSFGSSCLIVTGKSSAVRSGALADVTEVLESNHIRYEIYDRIAQNPTVASCLEGGKAAREMGAEFIIGIGGGSPLDAAKVVALAGAKDMTEEMLYGNDWPEAALPIVLVGTTAGTGSEVTNVAVLTDSRHRKHSVHDDRLYAALSLGDYRYTMSLPKSFTLSTGVDALAHCLESYFSRKASDISRAFSLRGLAILLKNLPLAGQPTEEVREALYNASILGGLAISVTGTVFPHNVGYYLSENYGVPHGTACAVFLPDLLNHLEKAVPEEAKAFYDALGTDRESLTALIKSTLPELDIAMTEEEIAAALPRWENNGSVKNTMGTVTAEDIRKILTEKFMQE